MPLFFAISKTIFSQVKRRKWSNFLIYTYICNHLREKNTKGQDLIEE